MDEKKLLEALGKIEDELIAEAAPGVLYERNSSKKMWVKWGSLAACILLIVGISIPGILNDYKNAEKQTKEQQGNINCANEKNIEKNENASDEMTTNEILNDETIDKVEKEEKTEMVSNAQNTTSVANNRNRSDYAIDTDTSLPKDNSKEESVEGIPSLSAEQAVTFDLTDEGFPNWGLSLTAENVTAIGMTLVCTQSGGELSGTLQTGSEYKLIVLENGTWNDVPTVLEEYGWNSIAYLIEKEADTKFEMDWEWLYGELPAGTYRLVKGFMDFRETGDYDSVDYWMEFEIRK